MGFITSLIILAKVCVKYVILKVRYRFIRAKNDLSKYLIGKILR